MYNENGETNMKLIKYGIKTNNKLLAIALTHASYAKEHGGESYERLEFLGDAVLQLIMSEYFYKHAQMKEGEMSKIRAGYVCENALFAYAERAGLVKQIKLGQGLINSVNVAIVADVFEAVVAAIYLTSGYSKAKAFVLDVAGEDLKNDHGYMQDYKSYLQELVQTTQQSVNYEVIKETGPAHNRTFKVEVIVEGITFGVGTGKSKKEAEQNAAADAIKKKARL